MALVPGDRLMGRYQVLEAIGAGGASSVSLALEEATQQKVVIKELYADSPELLDAFRAEFALLSRTTHPHLTRVFDFGSERLRGKLLHYYVAEYVSGSTLGEHARTAKGRNLLEPWLDALEGLHELHALGVRHGDFKPSNVLVSTTGHGVLIDLGCARKFGPSPNLFGTRGYLAPELLRGESGDARSDLYAAGVTLRELFALSGERPAPKIERLQKRLTAESPADRPSNVAEVLEYFGRTAPNLPVIPAAGTFVGREDELRTFERWLDAFLRGLPAAPFFVVTGERGMGVTRLTRELVARAGPRARVLLARGDEPNALKRLAGLALAIDSFDAVTLARALGELSEPTLLVLEEQELLAERDRELLHALSRLLDDEGRLKILLSGRTPLVGERCESVVIGALDRDALRALAGRLLSEQQLDALHSATQGKPGEVERALMELRGGRPRAGARRAEPLAKEERVRLSSEDRGALALLLVSEGVLDPAARGQRFEDFSGLLGAGIAEREGTRLRLSRRFSEDALRSLLSPRELELAHERAAAELSQEGADGAALARATRLFFLAGKPERAEAIVLTRDAALAAAGARELADLSGLARRSRNANALCRLAELAAANGAPRAGLRLAALATQRLRTSAGAAIEERRSLELRALLAAAEALTRLGRGARAERLLEASLSRKLDVEDRARLLDRLARARLQRGDYPGAESAAREGLSAELPEVLEGHLRETLGIALGYSGRTSEAELELQTALVRLGAQASSRERARIESHRGILAFRAGRVEQAAAAHRSALTLAERDGATDLAAVACLNLGTAEQQAGWLGAALESYERGSIFARATGRESTELTLRYNLANLYAEIGSFERAEELLDRLEKRAGGSRYEQFKPAIAILRAELDLYQERPELAARRLSACIAELAPRGVSRELAEATLRLADAELASGDAASARARLAELGETLGELDAADLELGLELGRARLEIAERDPAARTRARARSARRAQAARSDARDGALRLARARGRREKGLGAARPRAARLGSPGRRVAAGAPRRVLAAPAALGAQRAHARHRRTSPGLA
jgi:serine/threonine-protein kinase PknK